MMRLFSSQKSIAWAPIAAVFVVLLSSRLLFSMECISSKGLHSVEPPGLDQPSDMAIGAQGDIYLVDGVNNRIVVTDKEGTFKFDFGGSGDNPGEFRHPLGIDIAPDNRVFIADTGNHRIQVFNPEGEFLYMFPVRTSADKAPADPVDVLAIELENHLYVSDNENHKIKVYKQDGTFVSEWGGFGEVRGRFRYPGILAVNEFNQIFVVDVLNTRIQKFDPFGNFIAEIGNWGVSPGELFRPKGVAIDKAGRVFISDSFMGCVQVFSELGGFLGVICGEGEKQEFTTPVGLAFDAENRLHVVEMRANRIRVLQVGE